MDNFSDRLKLVIGSESVLSFSKRCGISETAMRSYAKGTLPGIDKAQKIAETGNVSLLWLITGQGSKDDKPTECPPEAMTMQEKKAADYDGGDMKARQILNKTDSETVSIDDVERTTAAVKRYLEKHGQDIAPDKFAAAVAVLCQISGEISDSTIARVIKLQG